MELEFFRAVRGDASVLTKIAYAAKRSWGYAEEWISSWRDSLAITPQFIEHNEVGVARCHGRPVGCYALTGAGQKLRLEHLWVLPDYQGKGIGRTLFTRVLREAAARGARQVEIESDPNAEGFYLRMGAQRAGEIESLVGGQKRMLPVLIINVHRHA